MALPFGNSMQSLKYKRMFISLLVAIAILNMVALWYGRDYMRRGYGDFAAFYTAAKLLQRGHASGLYDLKVQWSVQQEFASTVSIRNGPLPYIRPPFQAIVFLPLAYLDYQQAFLLWMGFKVLILFSIPFLLVPDAPALPRRYQWLAGFLCLSVGPVAMDLLQGQDAVLFLLVCALTIRSLYRGTDGLAGVWLGLGLFKFHLVLPVILLLALKRQRRSVFGFLVTAVSLLLVSGLLVGWRELVHYPGYLWNISHKPGNGVIQPQNMANLRGLFHMLPPSWWRLADGAYLVSVIAGIFAAWRIWASPQMRADRNVFVAGFCFSLPVALLVSFYFSGYDIIVLLLPAFLLSAPIVGDPRLPRWSKVIYAASLAFLLLIPISWAQLLQLHLENWDAIALLAFSGVLAYALSVWREKGFPLTQAPVSP